jgi:hypothetical protein
MAFTFPQWATALDLDFTTMPNQSLAVDGTVTVGTSPIFGTGLVWTKVNSASDATPMAITNGSGLIITPNAASNVSGAVFTAPALRIQLNSIIPDWTVFMPFRIWIWESASNETANNDKLFFGTYVPNAGFQNQLTLGHWRGFGGAVNGWGSQFTVLNTDVTTTGTSIPLSANRVGIMYCPMGVLGGIAPLIVGSTVTVTSTTIAAGSNTTVLSQATTIAAGSNNVALPTGTINVASTTGFSTSGTIFVVTTTGPQLVTYTNTTGTTFTGCTGGTGTMTTGNAVTAATVIVASTAGFAPSGIINVTSSTGSQIVAYTGITGTSFTGCTSGGITPPTGTLSTGGFVSFGTWPPTNSLTICNAAAITSAASAALSSTASGSHTVTENNLFLSAFRNGSGTAFSTTIARIRIDYLPTFN